MWQSRNIVGSVEVKEDGWQINGSVAVKEDGWKIRGSVEVKEDGWEIKEEWHSSNMVGR